MTVMMWADHRVPRFSCKGARVLVTGGSTGIGLEIAKELARRGAKVVISARREDVLKKAVNDVNKAVAGEGLLPPLSYVVMDVSNEGVVAAATALAAEQLGGDIDLLVCSAGFSHPSRFEDCSAAVARNMMEVNYFGCTNVVRAVLPKMTARGKGRVALVSSMAASAAIAGFTNYSPTKAALKAFAQALDMEVACLGIRVQLINPPDVETPGYEAENLVKSPECREICAMGGATPFTAEAMARASVDGIETYSFQVNLGFDGIMLGWGTAGMQPPTGMKELLGEFALGGILRLVAVVYTKLHYNIVANVRSKERSK
jgi:3-dehydrosphinganine reductase